MASRRTLSKIFNVVPAWGVCWERFKTAESMLDRTADLTLELGCSEWGGVAKTLVSSGKSVIGLDLKKEVDSSLTKRKGFSYTAGDARNLPFGDGTFDQVVCLDVLEHIKDDSRAVSEIRRVLKSGGTTVISVPSEYWRFPFHRFMRALTPNEEETLRSFGHVRKGYSEQQLMELFKGFELKEKKYFISGLSTLGYDIEFSKMPVIENLILKLLFPALYLDFRFGRKGKGTHLAVKFAKTSR